MSCVECRHVLNVFWSMKHAEVICLASSRLRRPFLPFRLHPVCWDLETYETAEDSDLGDVSMILPTWAPGQMGPQTSPVPKPTSFERNSET